MQQRLGRIEEWNDEKGYGFVRPLESAPGDRQRAFVHIRSFVPGKRRPGDGDLVRYGVQHDARNRLNAVQVDLVTATVRQPRQHRPARSGAGHWRTLLAACAWLLLAAGWLAGRWPGLLPLSCLALSLASFLTYRHDKVAAQRGKRRTPENVLHALDLFGGWPGGLLAQQRFRHKSSKTSFQAPFWLTVLVHCGAMAWLAWSGLAAHPGTH